MTDNLSIWNQFDKPPKTALKEIAAGRMRGKSDINPQWRMKAMTEAFGPCGVGWKFEIVRLWTEQGHHDELLCFAQVNVFIRHSFELGSSNLLDGQWSDAIPGIGGNKLVIEEKSGMHNNDEGYKMAVTDALGTAMKALGVAAEIYLGNFDGAKYVNREPEKKPVQCPKCKQSGWVTWQDKSGTWRCQKDKGGCGSVWQPGKSPMDTIVGQVAAAVAEASEPKFATEDMIGSLINIGEIRGYPKVEVEKYLAQKYQWPGVPLSWDNWKFAEKSVLSWPKKAGKETANAS